MSLPRRPPRRDELGCAHGGSQLQVQIYVARHASQLSTAVATALSGAVSADAIRWVAPKEAERFREPRGAKFLAAVGLLDRLPELRQFWPAHGPSWDAVGVVSPGPTIGGVILIEGKSYPREIYGPGCRARAVDSVNQIRSSMEKVRGWLGADPKADWFGRLYQYANRLAYLYFLRRIVRAPAWLVNLYFTGDTTTSPTSVAQWRGIRLPRAVAFS